MTKRSIVTASTTAALTIVPTAFAADTSDLGITVGMEAALASAFSATTLTAAETKFGVFVGTTSFTYKLRTSESNGADSTTVQVSTFGTGGTLVSDLSYICTAPTSGTACSSTAASTSTASSVVAFGGDVHSVDAGDAGTAVWALAARTGIHTSTATVTISATQMPALQIVILVEMACRQNWPFWVDSTRVSSCFSNLTSRRRRWAHNPRHRGASVFKPPIPASGSCQVPLRAGLGGRS
jgi:hypothetical protein